MSSLSRAAVEGQNANPVMRRGANQLLARIKSALLVAAGIALTVAPLSYAISPSLDDLSIAVGAALVLGVGIGQRVGGRAGTMLGLGVGMLVGLVAALVAGNISGKGVGILVTPVVGFSVGFIDGIGAARLRGFRSAVLTAIIIGGAIGLGMVFTLSYGGAVAGSITGLLVGTFAGMRRDSQAGWRGGMAIPPTSLLIIDAFFIAFVMYLAWSERQEWWMLLNGFGLILIVPCLFFMIGHWLASWLRPRLAVYAELSSYLRVMWVPMGAFALGYFAIIAVFAGFYGTLHRMDPAHAFSPANHRASIIDWLFFSFFMATGQDDPLLKATAPLARLLVSVETILCLGWIVVVFAAVMAYIQPQLERLTRGSSTSDDSIR